MRISLAATVLAAITWSGAAAPPAGTIVPAGTTAVARFSHAAARLDDGRVLVAGGLERNGVYHATAEVYEPSTGRFVPVGRMRSPRAGATATALPNGKVLVAGGSDGSGASTASTELFDPATNTFSAGGPMTTPRNQAIAVPLDRGAVLIIGGGRNGDADLTSTAEIYDSRTNRFTPTGSMRVPRAYFSGVRLADGRVLVAGGASSDVRGDNTRVEASAELYDPETGQFTPVGSMTMPRYKHGAAPMPDGRALFVGGSTDRATTSADTDVYEPGARRFVAGPVMQFARFKLLDGVVALTDGRILVAGGSEQPEVYVPALGAFIPVGGSKPDGIFFSTTTLLADGNVLIVDGYGRHPAPTVNHVWLYRR